MDRQFVYLGQQPLETDLLNTNKFAMIGLAKLAEALLGSSTGVLGLGCSPTAPASLQVQMNPGQIYSTGPVDATAFSSLAADTTHNILKQGLQKDAILLNCPAPVVAGQSINYLIQATYTDIDDSVQVLNYYNSANPTQAFAGPNNSGATQATVRRGACVVTAKAGAAAATGTQTTPAPDANNVGLYVITVAYAQTTITATSIAKLKNAPFIRNVAQQARRWGYFYANRQN